MDSGPCDGCGRHAYAAVWLSTSRQCVCLAAIDPSREGSMWYGVRNLGLVKRNWGEGLGLGGEKAIRLRFGSMGEVGWGGLARLRLGLYPRAIFFRFSDCCNMFNSMCQSGLFWFQRDRGSALKIYSSFIKIHFKLLMNFLL